MAGRGLWLGGAGELALHVNGGIQTEPYGWREGRQLAMSCSGQPGQPLLCPRVLLYLTHTLCHWRCHQPMTSHQGFTYLVLFSPTLPPPPLPPSLPPSSSPTEQQAATHKEESKKLKAYIVKMKKELTEVKEQVSSPSFLPLSLRFCLYLPPSQIGRAPV